MFGKTLNEKGNWFSSSISNSNQPIHQHLCLAALAALAAPQFTLFAFEFPWFRSGKILRVSRCLISSTVQELQERPASVSAASSEAMACTMDVRNVAFSSGVPMEARRQLSQWV
jgi:hypothetical protein